ncbi:hypothetical protein Q5752_002010 [Cryptotrichosporon argae]
MFRLATLIPLLAAAHVSANGLSLSIGASINFGCSSVDVSTTIKDQCSSSGSFFTEFGSGKICCSEETRVSVSTSGLVCPLNDWFEHKTAKCCIPKTEVSVCDCGEGYSFSKTTLKCGANTSNKCSSSQWWHERSSSCCDDSWSSSPPEGSCPSGVSCPTGWFWHKDLKHCMPRQPRSPEPDCDDWNSSTMCCGSQTSPSSGSHTRNRKRHAPRDQEAFPLTELDAMYCPNSLHACTINTGSGEWAYECVDFATELESCGGCASTGQGQDCTSIAHAKSVGCESGVCAVYSCAYGYHANGTSKPKAQPARTGPIPEPYLALAPSPLTAASAGPSTLVLPSHFVRPGSRTGRGGTRRRRVVSGTQRTLTVSSREEGRAMGLARGASMRRFNVWDDLPESQDPPPPFPFPTPSNTRQPPTFDQAAPPPPVPPPPRSPPPTFEQAIGTRPLPTLEEADDDDAAPANEGATSAQVKLDAQTSAPLGRPAALNALTRLCVPRSVSPASTRYVSAPSLPTAPPNAEAGPSSTAAAGPAERYPTEKGADGRDDGGATDDGGSADDDDDAAAATAGAAEREDRQQWNADLLAGYSLDERVAREAARRREREWSPAAILSKAAAVKAAEAGDARTDSERAASEMADVGLPVEAAILEHGGDARDGGSGDTMAETPTDRAGESAARHVEAPDGRDEHDAEDSASSSRPLRDTAPSPAAAPTPAVQPDTPIAFTPSRKLSRGKAIRRTSLTGSTPMTSPGLGQSDSPDSRRSSAGSARATVPAADASTANGSAANGSGSPRAHKSPRSPRRRTGAADTDEAELNTVAEEAGEAQALCGPQVNATAASTLPQPGPRARPAPLFSSSYTFGQVTQAEPVPQRAASPSTRGSPAPAFPTTSIPSVEAGPVASAPSSRSVPSPNDDGAHALPMVRTHRHSIDDAHALRPERDRHLDADAMALVCAAEARAKELCALGMTVSSSSAAPATAAAEAPMSATETSAAAPDTQARGRARRPSLDLPRQASAQDVVQAVERAEVVLRLGRARRESTGQAARPPVRRPSAAEPEQPPRPTPAPARLDSGHVPASAAPPTHITVSREAAMRRRESVLRRPSRSDLVERAGAGRTTPLPPPAGGTLVDVARPGSTPRENDGQNVHSGHIDYGDEHEHDHAAALPALVASSSALLRLLEAAHGEPAVLPPPSSAQRPQPSRRAPPLPPRRQETQTTVQARPEDPMSDKTSAKDVPLVNEAATGSSARDEQEHTLGAAGKKRAPPPPPSRSASAVRLSAQTDQPRRQPPPPPTRRPGSARATPSYPGSAGSTSYFAPEAAHARAPAAALDAPVAAVADADALALSTLLRPPRPRFFTHDSAASSSSSVSELARAADADAGPNADAAGPTDARLNALHAQLGASEPASGWASLAGSAPASPGRAAAAAGRPRGPRPRPPPVPPRRWKVVPPVEAVDLRAETAGPPAQSPPTVEAPPEAGAEATAVTDITDVDVFVARLEGTGHEYEGLTHLMAFLGPAKPAAASPAALASLLPGQIAVDSRRVTPAGKVKLKLSLLGMRVGSCPICLAQYREREDAVVLPNCGHAAHARCAARWFRESGTCMVCRVPLE